MVTSQSVYHGPKLRAICGTTQRGLSSTKIFNVSVDSVVRHWLLLMVEYGSVVHDGLGHAAGRILGMFYTDDGILVSQDLEWLQGTLNILIGLLWRIGLVANVTKSNTTTCPPGAIISGISQ